MYPQRIHQIMRHAVAVAGEEDDPRRRELGPIHLVKYVYLADLAHAEENHGTTYTGIPWRFHHFGPWAAEVCREIEPAMALPQIRRRPFQGELEDDAARWSLLSEGLPDKTDSALPEEVASVVEKAVRELGNDTSALLHHVYLSPPMLCAAPGEALDFSRLEPGEDPSPQFPEAETSKPLRLSPSGGTPRSRSKAELDALRTRFLELLRKPGRRRRVPVEPPPRYDEVFAEGQAWLDRLAGEPIQPEAGELVVSGDVWKSHARSDPGIP